MGNELIYKLNKLGQFFNLEKVATQKVDQSYIEVYYWINKIPYSLFHNKKGFVHMGVSVDGIYKEEDLFYQVKMIDKAVKSAGAQKVLEIATGRQVRTPMWISLGLTYPSLNLHSLGKKLFV